MIGSIPPKRRFIQPSQTDDWNSIAERELPDVPREEAIESLKSWNLHLVFRRISTVTPSDVVFIEPPVADPVA
ncbi:hypothetical protein [Sphingobium tyrosinilyticum]|uniref:Uncharacterized protein n=1 Tax=Sphingobium tyrosinilyticum TaxID=2715436 RepID=A0ABV9F1B9_9SPHN